METPLELKPDEIPDVPTRKISPVDIPDEKGTSDISSAQESLALQSELQIEKTETSDILTKTPERTDEKTVEYEEVTPGKEMPAESTTSLQPSETKPSEIKELQSEEVDKAAIKDTELQESLAYKIQPKESKTLEISEETSVSVTTEVREPAEVTTQPTEISANLVKLQHLEQRL